MLADCELLLAVEAELLLAVLWLEDDLLLLLSDVRLGVDQLDQDDRVLWVEELCELDSLLADCELSLQELSVDSEQELSVDSLQELLLDELALDGVLDDSLMLELDLLLADCELSLQELAELSLQELTLLAVLRLDDGLPRLLTLEGVELIDDVLIDCDVLVVLSELWLLVEDRDELLAELLELIDWLEADEPPVVLGVLALDSLLDDRLEGVRLLEDELLSDWLLLLSVDELTPEDGVLLLLPPVVDSDVLLSDVADVSLSHSVARMYGGNDWAPLKIRELPVLNLRIAGSKSSPPAASVSSNSHWMLSSSVTVRYSVSPASTRVVRRSRPANPKVPILLTFQILTVRESKMPVGAGPSQKVIVLAMLAPRNEKNPGRLQREVSNPLTTPGLSDLDLYVAQTAEILIVRAFICQEGILIRKPVSGLQTRTSEVQTSTVIV